LRGAHDRRRRQVRSDRTGQGGLGGRRTVRLRVGARASVVSGGRLRIERRGGLAGKPAAGERDLTQLTPEQRAALTRLLDASGPASGRSAPAKGADRFSYKVRYTDTNGTREFEVGEDAMPDALASIPQIDL